MPHLVKIATDPKNASIKDVVSGHFNTNSLAKGGGGGFVTQSVKILF